ncbi:hypothetical protein IVA87_24810 [Bradyrhizobium sp. 147]|uniref:hypothetical protein n=1 Tax=Bradyrhizobium sp. 147 TaxID=2782623 RepID=UPI001FFB7789|nr:hypothetical protein [Bradyrhizobium sp. 147]MCK1682541.1 hypothetical protein [Bradyrhizobium sp. 147]
MTQLHLFGVIVGLAVFAEASPAQHRMPGEAVGGAGTGRSSIPEASVAELALAPHLPRRTGWPVKPGHDGGDWGGQRATSDADGVANQIATLVRDLARAPLQSACDTSIKRTSFNRAGRDLHDFDAFADRTPALDILARYVLGLIEALSASLDWAKISTKRPDRSASQVKVSFE